VTDKFFFYYKENIKNFSINSYKFKI
jgi:hypothetical protein